MKIHLLTLNSLRTRWLSAIALVSALAIAGGAYSAGAATSVVKMVNFAFQPQTLTINAGDTVLWTNTTASFHNVVSSNSVWAASGLFPSPGTFSFTFNSAGVFGYYCSPHQLFGMTGVINVQAAANQPPTVSITNPPSGITLAAPATVTLRATASDPDGSVANVQFFSTLTSLGTVTTSPYALTISNLSAGAYSFTAKAVDNLGLSATSIVVTVTVVTPGTIRFDSNLALSSGKIPLRISTTTGLNYALEYSITLTNWLTLTNFAATNSLMSFTDPAAVNSHRFFRARLLPNP